MLQHSTIDFKMKKILASSLLAFLLPGSVLGQAVIFVDIDAIGGGDGTSWNLAFHDLQDALHIAASGDQVWVAEGTYLPDRGAAVESGNRTESFVLRGGVSLYGGFAGTENSPAERNIDLNTTFLSGDLSQNDEGEVAPDNPLRAENSEHVITLVEDDTSHVVIDGVSVSGGQADSTSYFGGGLFLPQRSYAIVRQSVFQNNVAGCGGAIGGRGTLDVNDVHFETNHGAEGGGCFAPGGGAISISGDERQTNFMVVRNSRFESNFSAGCGGAIAVGHRMSASIVESSFTGNLAGYGAAVCAIWIRRPYNLLLVNDTFTGNIASTEGAGALDISDAHVEVYNSLFNTNSVVDTVPYDAGGAIGCYDGGSLTVSSSTFVANYSPSVGAIGASLQCPTSISNSIFWNNQSDSNIDIRFLGAIGTMDISYSILERHPQDGIVIGDGVIMLNPLFRDFDGENDLPGDEDDDYTLTALSPGIDAGANALVPRDSLDLDADGNTAETLPYDLALNQRVLVGSSNQAIVDVGAYENIDFASSVENTAPWSDCNMVIFPNPTFGTVSISTLVPQSGIARLEFSDVMGRRVADIKDFPIYPGGAIADIDLRSLAAGVYFAEMTFHNERRPCRSSIIVNR